MDYLADSPILATAVLICVRVCILGICCGWAFQCRIVRGKCELVVVF